MPPISSAKILPYAARAFAAHRFHTTRFAPSPTGFLHLGHVASALAVYAIGRALGARVLLRIEDHDRGRSRDEYETAIHEDLSWLGFDFDDHEKSRARPSPYRQSDAPEVYQETMERLDAKGLLYGCDCARSRLAGIEAPRTTGAPGELIYDGHCRDRGLNWRGVGIGIRMRLPDDTVAFDDAWLGQVMQTPSTQCGDILLRERHGNDTYQFAVTVDDYRQGIDLVVRGQDLIASTGRQILLARALGRTAPPVFAHHPLLFDDDGQKLGKRFFSEAIAKRRAGGESPEALIGVAACRLGLTATEAPLKATEAAALCREILAK